MASVVWRPRSLATRQLLAATLGLLAFLALVGYALDRAFVDTAESNLRQRLESYAMAYAGDTDFDRAGDIVPPYISPDPRFDRPG
ncbi:MAG: two-component sensor histidine kinase, partial [Luteimonas sp.]